MMRRLIVLTALLLGAAPALAQERALGDQALTDALRRADLPREARSRIDAFLSDPATARHTGELRISASEMVRGGIAVLDGPVTVAGHVQGGLLLLRGTVRLERTARVDGDLTVVCGEVVGATSVVGGTVTVYDRAFCGEAFAKSAPATPRSTRRRAAPFVEGRGSARLSLRVG